MERDLFRLFETDEQKEKRLARNRAFMLGNTNATPVARKKFSRSSSPPDVSDGGVNQDKLDAHHAAETAKHIAESARRRLVREAANAAAKAKGEKPYTKPGPSGPVREGRAPDPSLPLDERAREEVRKHDSIEAAAKHEMALKQQEADRVAEQVHKLEIRRKGYKINEEQKEK